MAQHFLLTRKAKSLNLATVFRMPDAEAEAEFRRVRWPETNGAPVCPECGGLDAYECRRPSGSLRFRCRACRRDFSITSGTLFASHKLPLRTYLGAIAIFCNEVKGKAALALSRDLGVSYKSAFVLAHKIREAMAEEMKGCVVGGEGKTAEVDGAYFGGYRKPANHKENRRDRRLAVNQNGKRKSVIIVRERSGLSVPAVFRSESAALAWIKSRIVPGTIVHADEAPGWDALHSAFKMKRIDHSKAYSEAGACTNMARASGFRALAPLAPERRGEDDRARRAAPPRTRSSAPALPCRTAGRPAMTSVDRRIWWLVGLIAVAILLWLLLDHLLFPTLPVPAGAPSIAR